MRLLPSDVAADVVIRVRPDAYRAAFADLGADIDRALVQLVRWRATAPDAVVSASQEASTSQSSDT